jgi:hypothetical protein
MTKESGHEAKDEGSRAEQQISQTLPDRTLIPFFLDLHTSEGEARFDAVQKALKDESDRSAAILGFSILEWRIRQVIEFRLCNTGKRDSEGKPILDKQKQAAVAALIGDGDEIVPKFGIMDQCRMAYSLNLIGPVALKDISRMAKVRNRFAHQFQIMSFIEDSEIRARCMELQSPEMSYQELWGIKATKPKNPTNEDLRKRYIGTVTTLHMMPWEVTCHFPFTFPEVTTIERDIWVSSAKRDGENVVPSAPKHEKIVGKVIW